jgi:hypothetical protein
LVYKKYGKVLELIFHLSHNLRIIFMEQQARKVMVIKDGKEEGFMTCDECKHDMFEVKSGWWCDEIICARCGNLMPDPGFGAM